MGLHTTFLGRITISPPLSPSDVDLVNRLSDRHPFDAPERPEWPVGRSPWVACDDGCCLHWDGLEKPQFGESWLSYVIDLIPAVHDLNGMVVGERHEHRELFALVVRHRRVQRRVLMEGASDSELWGGLPLDREKAERREELRRRRERYALAVARDLARQEDGTHDGPSA